ncbi:hypothetical protein MMPV_005236 [Pyropia vietnamensis]
MRVGQHRGGHVAGHSPMDMGRADELLVGTATAMDLETRSNEEVDAAVTGGMSRLTVALPPLRGTASGTVHGWWLAYATAAVTVTAAGPQSLTDVNSSVAGVGEVAPAAPLRRAYTASTRLPGPGASLHWSLQVRSIDLALVISAPNVVTRNATALWVGFGIGDPSSGSMLGADIVTAEFPAGAAAGGSSGSGSNGSGSADGRRGRDMACALVDRHVPMVSYPLDSSVGGDAVFPVPDDCPDKESWVLAACAVDSSAGTLTLEVSRSLAAPDPAQDRTIVAGRNILMYAYGDGFGYHGAARQTFEVDLVKGKGKEDAILSGDLFSTGGVPADADGEVLLTMPNYAVSNNETDYGCATFELPPPPSGREVQVVAAEAVIDTTTAGGRLAHHLVVLSCVKTPLFDEFKAGRSCIYMIPTSGLPITADARYFLLQVHYDNPDGLQGLVDNTSVRFHTTTKPRRYDSGVIRLGNTGIFIDKERVQSGINYTYTCPSECTSQMAEPVTVFYSALHAHYTALHMWTNVYRNGTFFKTIEGTKFWSNDHQRPTLFEPFVLYPGDRLTVSAEYGVDKLVAAGREAPAWGAATHDEMLLSSLFVYPRPRRTGVHAAEGDTITGCGGYQITATGEDWTVCGGRAVTAGNASARIEGVDWFNRSARAAVDEAGWSDPFGELPTCKLQQGPTPSPVATNHDGGGGGHSSGSGECFPAAATVRRRRGGMVSTARMDDLRLGDEVLAAGGVYARVYLWSHADATAVAAFVRLVATRHAALPPRCERVTGVWAPADCTVADMSQSHSLLVSAGHLLPAVAGGDGSDGDPTLTAAASLKVGDTLFAADGSPLTLTAVQTGVPAVGLYHPHTMAGNLVVDGVMTSDLTTALPSVLARVALAPLRAAAVAGLAVPAMVVSWLLRGGCKPVVRVAAAARRSVGT